MVKYLFLLVLIGMAVSGCAARRAAPVGAVKGAQVVCILSDESFFKSQVIERIRTNLRERGVEVITDARKRSGYYHPAEYGAVVYMTEYWAWHTPWHTKRYYRKYSEAKNIIFFITAGDSYVKIKKPFDAVTSASNPDSIERVSREILTKLDTVLAR